MLEYVFFDQRPCDGFTEYVAQLGLQPLSEVDDGMYKVLLPEDIPDSLAEQVEAHYDRMMELNRSLFETEGAEEDVGYHAAGITVALQDGSNVYAQVPAQLLGRILQVLSTEEFNEVVNAIVTAVENPDARSLCQRMRDQQPDGWE